MFRVRSALVWACLILSGCSSDSTEGPFVSLNAFTLTTVSEEAYPEAIVTDYGVPTMKINWEVDFRSDAGTYQVTGYLGNTRSPKAKLVFNQTCDNNGSLGCGGKFFQTCSVGQNFIACGDKRIFIEEKFSGFRLEACVSPEDSAKICQHRDLEFSVTPFTGIALPEAAVAAPSLSDAPAAQQLMPPSVRDWVPTPVSSP